MRELNEGVISKIYVNAGVGYVNIPGTSRHYPFSLHKFKELVDFQRIKIGKPCKFSINNTEEVTELTF